MKKLKVGDHSKAICPNCEEIVSTTFRLADYFYNGYVIKKVLRGFCDKCGEVVSFPHQSTKDIVKFRKKMEKKIPKGYYCEGCQFYRTKKGSGFNKRNNGFCDFMNKGDIELIKERTNHPWKIKIGKTGKERKATISEKKWLAESGSMSLLWDGCKECNINMKD